MDRRPRRTAGHALNRPTEPAPELSTIFGWSYYGEKAARYLFGTNVIRAYRVPNLIVRLALSGMVVAEAREYIWPGNPEQGRLASRFKQASSARFRPPQPG